MLKYCLGFTMLALASCSQPHKSETMTLLPDGHWQLLSVQGQEPPIGVNADLLVDGASVTGRSGCNRFNGQQRINDKGSLQLGPFAATRMLCAEDQNKLEQLIFSTFSEVKAYKQAGKQLILLDTEGVSVSIYEQVES
ncbi:META domain-containing protein [Agaribacterium sp. ZY112]|uniref:META domain-containing protein n=1 Tax=Agaribacterium sp. ZY112 TaxID=3233574 RepID=UPI003523E2F1